MPTTPKNAVSAPSGTGSGVIVGVGGTNQAVEFHPLAQIFPLLDERHLQALANDIAVRGLLDEIVLYDGKILDGRSRFLACQRVSVPPTFRDYVGDDPLGFVISRNVNRRHLTKNQRLLAAARAATLPVGSNQNTPGLPIGTAAELFEVSARNIAREKAILRRGTVEVVQAVESGRLAISRATSICELTDDNQAAALREIGRKRVPREKGKAPAGENKRAAADEAGEVPPADHAAHSKHDYVVPTALGPRNPMRLSRDFAALYDELLAAWFKAPKLVRLKFVEEVIHEG